MLSMQKKRTQGEKNTQKTWSKHVKVTPSKEFRKGIRVKNMHNWCLKQKMARMTRQKMDGWMVLKPFN